MGKLSQHAIVVVWAVRTMTCCSNTMIKDSPAVMNQDVTYMERHILANTISTPVEWCGNNGNSRTMGLVGCLVPSEHSWHGVKATGEARGQTVLKIKLQT